MHSADREREKKRNDALLSTQKEDLILVGGCIFKFFFLARRKEKNEGIEGMNVPGKEELGNVGWKNKVLKEEIP